MKDILSTIVSKGLMGNLCFLVCLTLGFRMVGSKYVEQCFDETCCESFEPSAKCKRLCHCNDGDDVSKTQIHGSIGPDIEEMTDQCLECIQAAHLVYGQLKCRHNENGKFCISYDYWAKADKPIIKVKSPREKWAMSYCVFDVSCSKTTVRAYMKRYSKDCNGDGKVDCDDYIRIHHRGYYECADAIPRRMNETYNKCMHPKSPFAAFLSSIG